MEQIDWANLGFSYMKTDFNIRCEFKNETWGDLEIHESEFMNLHMAATSIHYGQEVFEGLKAFRGVDGKIRIFRMRDNALRMQDSCAGTMMAQLPVEKFEEAVLKAVKLNERFIPPYESGASLYIRPFLFGSGAQVGVKPSTEYLFIVFVTPVGPYFANLIVRHRWEWENTKWVEIMLPVWLPDKKRMNLAIQIYSIWTQRKRNTLTNVVLPTFSE